MSKYFRWLAFLGLLALITVTLRSPQAAAGQAATAVAGTQLTFLPYVSQVDTRFVETFDGDPAVPTPWNSPNWDIAVHSRDASTFYQLESMAAGHGSQCDPPPATHTTSSYAGAVFQCRNHMMTAIKAGGYGEIVLTPNRMVVFEDNIAIIRIDASTLRTSGRDWWDIWITPYDDNLILPLAEFYPDLSGDPKRAVHVEMEPYENSNGFGAFKASVIRNHQATVLPMADWYLTYEDFLQPSATRRDTFELQISRYGMRFGMPEYNKWWINTTFSQPLDWSTGVVQFGHHSYNPTKVCNHNGTCGPNTWHWDNVIIDPALPFTIIPANSRYTEQSTGGTLTFARRHRPVRTCVSPASARICRSASTAAPAGRTPSCRTRNVTTRGTSAPTGIPFPPACRASASAAATGGGAAGTCAAPASGRARLRRRPAPQRPAPRPISHPRPLFY